jgi:hypothetical protein
LFGAKNVGTTHLYTHTHRYIYIYISVYIYKYKKIYNSTYIKEMLLCILYTSALLGTSISGFRKLRQAANFRKAATKAPFGLHSEVWRGLTSGRLVEPRNPQVMSILAMFNFKNRGK